MLIVHAGNRVDAERSDSPARFPAEHVPVMRNRLGRLLEHAEPKVVVSAAAAGSDLSILQEALRLSLAVHVVLPFARDVFRERSVADRGSEWVEAYDRVLDTVTRRGDSCTLVELDLPDTTEGYRQGNQALLDHVCGLTDAGEPLAVAVRPAAGGGASSVTDDFVERAQAQGFAWIDLDPGIRPADMRSAFVAMPYGTKPRGSGSVNCEEIFGRLIVPALEDADLMWQRADKAVDTGLIHLGMIEQLGNADVVIVDTVTHNPNVFYELGLRHSFADKTTVLLGPAGDSPPFDVRPIRHFSYRLRDGSIEELSALAAIADLRAVLDRDRLESARRDSPVFEFFDLERLRLRPRGGTDAGPSLSLQLHQQVTEAVSGRNVETLGDLVRTVRAAPVDADQRRQLLLRLGIALREQGRYDETVDTLRPLAFTAGEGPFSLWAQQLALALRRQGERDLADGRDPEPAWNEGQHLLDQVIGLGDDPESCGIAGGLQKRRGLRALAADDRLLATAHLRAAAELYERGFAEAPSDYYTGLNAVTTLRILTHHLGGSPDLLDRARRLAPVAAFFAERAATSGVDAFWPLVSVAELAFTWHLLDGEPGEPAVEEAYLRAALLGPTPDQARAVLDQLELYHRLGDAPALLERLEARFRPFLRSRC